MTDSHLNRTAEMMLEHLGSDGDPGWVFFRQFGQWEMLFNRNDDRRFVPKLVGNLERRGLVETRRASGGMQVRMTNIGREHCDDERRHQEAFTAEFGVLLLDDVDQTCPSDSAKSLS